MSREALTAELQSELLNEPHYALIACFKMETANQTLELMHALEWILDELFQIKGLAGLETAELSQIHKLRFCMPGILDEFRRPEIVLGILGEAE